MGGAFFTLHAGVVSPAFVGVQPSVELVIWAILGGRESFLGAVVASVLGGFVRDRVSSVMPDLWLYAMGVLLVLLVLAPTLWGSLPRKWRRKEVVHADASQSGKA